MSHRNSKSKIRSIMKNIRIIAAAVLLTGLAAGAILFFLERRVSPWTVTQYGSSGENQMMFYTITNPKGQLVIIDGGWDTDAGEVRRVIDGHGGHVDAWIITHPHPDHVGAFNAIMAANTDGSVVVDRILTVPVNGDRYRETAHTYDVIEAYEIFDLLTKDADNVEYLRENDTFSVIGLEAKVLHSWDENVDALPDHLCNDGSMMFRVEGKRDSMLFCADVQSEMEEFILPEHREELKADYVQCAHHGNWGLTTDFYDIVSPKAAFFDAPSSVIDNEDSRYDGYLLRDYFADAGIPVYRPETAPNRITLR